MNKKMTALSTDKMAKIQWDTSCPFHYENMVRVRTIQNASSFLHAILNAFFQPYRSNKFNGVKIDRHDLVKTIRDRLAARLHELVDPEQSDSVRIYDVLARGRNKQIASAIKSYTIEVMQSELMDQDHMLDDKYLELISNELNKDIYILNAIEKDVWVAFGDTDLFYKHRGSIVIMALPQHFETVGIASPEDPEDVKYHFDPESQFIQALKARYDEVKRGMPTIEHPDWDDEHV